MGSSSNDWRHFHRWSDDYEKGLGEYLEKKFATAAHGHQIACPCKKCENRYWFCRNVVKDHVICKGFGSREERNLEQCLDSMADLDKKSELEAESERGKSGHSKDPYYEVMKIDEHKGRVRLYGRGVTRTMLKNTGKANYIFPKEFLESIISELIPIVTNLVISQLQAANPGINLVVPQSLLNVPPGDASSSTEQHQDGIQRRQSSAGTRSNQVIEESGAEDGP